MHDERKTDPSGLRYNTIPPTLPSGVYTVPHEVLQYLIDSQFAIHEEINALKREAEASVLEQRSALVSENPPPWAKRLFSEISEQVASLETEVQRIKNTCASRHGNGQLTLSYE